MTDCIIKAFGGCACKDGECAETHVTPAPVVLISLKTQAIVCLFIGFVAMIGSAAWMESHYRTDDLTNQEASVNVDRR
ncbi:hypothetical protein [Rhizobium leguminosarum]|uniref:hypothetical protein n=1 Tax=Rhizobium leguminosarum TaxID=384 RepID=UPI001C967AE6|nr:hypothetical protein [Rhizobium leguminosarum]MBY5821444.1 hypothetical protein [Rhizobium leguminosarum]